MGLLSAFALAALAAGCGEAAGPAALGARLAGAEGAASPAMSDAAKRALALDVLERFVPRAERAWRAASDLREPRTAYYDAVGSGVTQPRGAGAASGTGALVFSATSATGVVARIQVISLEVRAP